MRRCGHPSLGQPALPITLLAGGLGLALLGACTSPDTATTAVPVVATPSPQGAGDGPTQAAALPGITTEDEEDADTGPDVTETVSPDGRRKVSIIMHGDGRDIQVAADGGPAASIGPEAMHSIFAAADPGGGLFTVSIYPVGWDGPRALRLQLVSWAAGREPANLPPVEVVLDVDTGSLLPTATP